MSGTRLQQRMQGVLPTGKPYELRHRTAYRVHERVAERYVAGRVLLAGDAAHVNNPLGGMGMNSGVHDAINLAGRLAAVWRGEPLETLGRYERQRRKVALDVVQQQALSNRQMLNQRDPAARAAYHDELRAIEQDPRQAPRASAADLDDPVAARPGSGGVTQSAVARHGRGLALPARLRQPAGSMTETTGMFDFKGKRVVVCGGSRGIGRSIALGFAQAGAAVSICARSAGPLDATRAEIAALGVTAHAAACDLGDRAAVTAYVAEAAAALGGIDVLVNNASGFGCQDTEEHWAQGLSVDVMATVRATHAALPFLEAAKGCIVNVSSISGYRPTSHAGLCRGEGAADQLHPVPGGDVCGEGHPRECGRARQHRIPRRLLGGAARPATRSLYNRILAGIPFGRLGTPEEVAEVAMFLASPAGRAG